MKCDLVRYLIMNGATIRFEENQTKKSEKILKGWKLNWFDI